MGNESVRLISKVDSTNVDALVKTLKRTKTLHTRLQLNAIVADWIALTGTHTAATRLQLAGIPASASRNLMELLSDEHLLMRGVFPLTPQGSRGIALPWQDEKGWRGKVGSVPQLGEHNDYVFGELLGLDRSQIEELIGSGAIG